jgi:hypothetical protein
LDLIPDVFFETTVDPAQAIAIEMTFSEGVRRRDEGKVDEANRNE